MSEPKPKTSLRPMRTRNVEIEQNDFTPRPYQIELYEKCKSGNRIIFLQTGTGKTFIAIMLIKHYSWQMIHSLPNDPHNLTTDEIVNAMGKKTVFLVPVVPLVEQQALAIEKHTDLNVGRYHGMDTDKWTKDIWIRDIMKKNVLVMIHEIFRKVMQQGFVPWNKINLLILDEVHHATKNHPYREIMSYLYPAIEQIPTEDHPRILGMSASLVNIDAPPEKIEMFIKKLEVTMHSTCETSYDLFSLNKYAAKPKEQILVYPKFNLKILKNSGITEAVSLCKNLVNFLDDTTVDVSLPVHNMPVGVKTLKKILNDTLYIMQEMGFWCAKEIADLYINEISNTLEMIAVSRNLHAGYMSAVVSMLCALKTAIDNFLKRFKPKDRLKFSSPKLIYLLHLFNKYNKKIGENGESTETVQNLCGIIFCERRSVARVVSKWLQEMAKVEPDKYGFLKVDYVVGHGGNAANDVANLAIKRQEETLKKFRFHEYNLLVSTSVLEEGLDVPRCNLVVRYDFPKTLREYVQSKGRARAENGKYVILAQNESLDMTIIDLQKYKKTENILSKICHNRTVPSDEESKRSFEDNYLMEPYMPDKSDGAARITLNSAVALVNRYCAKLPSDSFTKLTPQFKIESFDDGFRCKLRLPINSPVRREIISPKMPFKRVAKKAAAQMACEELHKAGELDNNFIPVGKESIKFIDELGLEPINEESVGEGEARPGSTKRRQYYNKRIADVLNHSPPSPETDCFLYVFNTKLRTAMPEEHNTRGRKITDPADSSRNFGILTTQKVPPICAFPIFTRAGEVIVYFEPVRECFKLSITEIDDLSIFHQFTFNDVLRLIKNPLKYNPDKSNSSYFIVPVNVINEVKDIDWDFVRLIKDQRERPLTPVNDDNRKSFKFEREKYYDAVVIPWYRLDKPQFFFYVAEICENLTPKSPFPDAGYKTFEQYYQSKYKINIMNYEQPLLDVDHTSARLNLLTPRYVNRKGITLPTSTAKTKKEKRENLQQKQILVPELCSVHPFPAPLWRKAVCLPSLLFRLNSLLVSEQLRAQISKESGVGIINTDGIEWDELNFGWTLEEVLTQPKDEPINGEKIEESSENVPANAMETWTFDDLNEPTDVANNDTIKAIGAAQDDDELVIDTFDPSKYPINEDEDFDDDYNMFDPWTMSMAMPVNIIGGPNGFSNQFLVINDASSNVQIRELNDNGDIEDSASDNSDMRVASPSYFNPNERQRGWELSENVKSVIHDIGLPQLTYISSDDRLNIKELSKDLANYPVEGWDSGDDESDINDVDSDDDDDDDDEYRDDTDVRNPNAFAKQRNFINSTDYQLLSEIPAPPAASRTMTEIFRCLSPEVTDPELTNSSISNQSDDYIDDFEIITVEIDSIFSFDDIEDANDSSEEFKYDDHDNANDDNANDNSDDSAKSTKYDSDDGSGDFCKRSNKIINGITQESHTKEYDNNLNASKECITSDSLVKMNAADEKRMCIIQKPGFGDLLKDRDICIDNDNKMIKFDAYKYDDEIIGPSPSLILQAITMSNASDGINLERLETVGDSFLKYAVTAFLFSVCPSIHEGKLSYLRSRQISNSNLYRLGKKIGIGDFMNATKFEPNDNWCPPCYTTVKDECPNQSENVQSKSCDTSKSGDKIPYNLLTEHSIPDKSIADCVEALIGAYLISSGPKGALLFMKWLDLRVMPAQPPPNDDPNDPIWHWLSPPKSPLIDMQSEGEAAPQLTLDATFYKGQKLDKFESKLGYSFRDKAYLVQAFTHNSFYENLVTDCYQRLEFLGDAVLDYVITRYLYEDKRKYSPGTLTDLRSALVNNTFFASLAVKYEFHKYLQMLSIDLFRVIKDFVERFQVNDNRANDCSLFIAEGESENSEDIEVPKALGDIFESVAGAVYLDSGMSLDAVWRVYYRMMKPEIDYYSNNVPKSPIRELLEMEPQNAKFGKPELIPGRKMRVCVEVFGEGKYFGVGRNKRIAKCTAAKRALRALKAKRNKN